MMQAGLEGQVRQASQNNHPWQAVQVKQIKLISPGQLLTAKREEE